METVIIEFDGCQLTRQLGLYSSVSLCLIKYVVVNTLTEKKQPITQIRRPHYQIWVIYHQDGNQWSMQHACVYMVVITFERERNARILYCKFELHILCVI